jgi:hypothetical protein
MLTISQARFSALVLRVIDAEEAKAVDISKVIREFTNYREDF